MSKNFKFELGERVRDRITGRIGTVVSRQDSLHRCNKYDVLITPKDWSLHNEGWAAEESQLMPAGADANKDMVPGPDPETEDEVIEARSLLAGEGVGDDRPQT